MIYFLLLISVITNGILVWYIKKLINNHLINEDKIDTFILNIDNYTQFLEHIYKLEELYGDETIRKAIVETKNFIDTCRNFKGNFTELPAEQEPAEDLPPVITLKDGEKVTQDASKYRRVIPE